MQVEIKSNFTPVNQMLIELGVNTDGAVQKQWTADVMRRMRRYMPYRTGATATKLTYMRSANEIEVTAPYARYLYMGKVMVDAETGKGPAHIPGVGYRFWRGAHLTATDRPLQYTHDHNPQAGPFWDRTMVAAEGDQMLADLQRFVDGRKKR